MGLRWAIFVSVMKASWLVPKESRLPDQGAAELYIQRVVGNLVLEPAIGECPIVADFAIGAIEVVEDGGGWKDRAGFCDDRLCTNRV